MGRSIFTGFFLLCLSLCGLGQQILDTPNTESVLYLGPGNNQPLIVGLGGSEGGNAWTSDYWKATRDQFIRKGYAFLAIGYFGAKGTPPILDKIALEDVYTAITTATREKQVSKDKIAIIGGSRGGDLALLLASYYSTINCVVAIVPSHVAFPGHTQQFNSSCWTYNGKELAFVPVNDASIPLLMKRDLRGAFEAMLQDTAVERNALIRVEKINGPVLLVSATKDEICPSTPMSEKMMKTFKLSGFKFPYEHIAIEGGHSEPLKHFDRIHQFIDSNFKQ